MGHFLPVHEIGPQASVNLADFLYGVEDFYVKMLRRKIELRKIRAQKRRKRRMALRTNDN